MTLNSFREKLSQHESGLINMARNLIWGEEADVTRIKLFLKGFDSHQPSHEFSYADSFQLLWLLKSYSQTTLIQQLKNQLTFFLGKKIINLMDRLEAKDQHVNFDNFNSKVEDVLYEYSVSENRSIECSMM